MVETTQSNRNTMILAEKTALVVIDLQQGIAHPSRQGAPHESSVVVGNTSRLARAFAEEGGFVVLVRVSSLDGKDLLKPDTDMHLTPGAYPAGWDDIVPELAEVKGAHVVTKRQWGAFYGTDLDLQLRRRGIDTIVLCGISTSIGLTRPHAKRSSTVTSRSSSRTPWRLRRRRSTSTCADTSSRASARSDRRKRFWRRCDKRRVYVEKP
ncbi:hypothetical protein HMSSN139_50120 [Paenibacillus sp. HMSSN-139]|nr:hypothetical protein HMSSN139_50120 [Paenibacillus sp. HMSSN-139]